MSKRQKTYPFIGEVNYVKSRRARRLILSVRPGRGVRLTLPWNLAFIDAEAFLLRHMDWLKEKVAEVSIFEQTNQGSRDPEIQKREEEALRRQAKGYLPGRTAQLAARHGFSYTRVSLRASRTRWGSCSAVNNINLSIFLMRLPTHLIDYVILHELVHTVHKNHGKGFWQLLEHHTGGAKALAAEIRKYMICARPA